MYRTNIKWYKYTLYTLYTAHHDIENNNTIIYIIHYALCLYIMYRLNIKWYNYTFYTLYTAIMSCS